MASEKSSQATELSDSDSDKVTKVYTATTHLPQYDCESKGCEDHYEEEDLEFVNELQDVDDYFAVSRSVTSIHNSVHLRLPRLY